MAKDVYAKVFWSGGSQAVRLPKALRLTVAEVTVKRKGNALILEPVGEGDDWTGFWDRLMPLKEPVRRWPTPPTDKRQPL